MMQKVILTITMRETKTGQYYQLDYCSTVSNISTLHYEATGKTTGEIANAVARILQTIPKAQLTGFQVLHNQEKQP